MLPADTLTCQVTPDSIEPRSLSCSMPPLEHLELWDSMLSNAGTWATVLSTLLLAYFAWKAWDTSQATLKTMEQQLVDQKSVATDAIAANRQLAMDSRQLGLLADYCAALISLGDAAGKPDADIRQLSSDITRAWMIWGMNMFRIDKDFRTLTGEWNVYFRAECEALLKLDHPGDDKAAHETLVGFHADAFRTNIGSYVGNLQVWETDVCRRSEVKGKFSVLRDSEPEPEPDSVEPSE